MLELRKLKLLVCLVLILACFASRAQTLQIDDVFKAYSLDSVDLKQFCLEKKFHLNEVSEDSYRSTQTYQSDDNNKISFVRTFPKRGTSVFFYYYFDDQYEYKNFKKLIKTKGFKYDRSYEMFPNSKQSDYRERYNSDKLTFELGTSNFGNSRYFVLLYSRLDEHL